MLPIHFPVSKSAPFLSNLNIIDNLTLILEHKVHFLHHHFKDIVKEKLARFNLEDLALKHHSTISDHDYFVVQLIRASLIEDASVVIDTPFYQVSLVKDISPFIKMFELLELDSHKVEIVDYVSEESKYKEDQCHIEKCLLV
jgi:ABC-type lipopolysaccharide export system ATPase subunit